MDEHETWDVCFEIQEHISAAEELSKELYKRGYEKSVFVDKRLRSAAELLHDIWMWIEEPIIEIPFD